MSKKPLPVDVRRSPKNGKRMGPTWAFTRHAVERYMSRVEPGCVSWIDAKRKLLEQALQAVNTMQFTALGDPMWACPNGTLLVVKREHHVHVVVTVLCATTNDDEPFEDEVA
jgi:hypothetical protein